MNSVKKVQFQDLTFRDSHQSLFATRMYTEDMIPIAEEMDKRGRPINPLTGFLLGNGARVAKSHINFAANTSERGLQESCGLMVNYVYSQRALAPIGRAVRSLLPWGRA